MRKARPLAKQIVSVFLGLLLIVLSAVAVLAHWVNSRQLSSDLEAQLERAERIVHRQLSLQRQQLEGTVSILASDYGFRDALSSADTETILSALENHGSRIGAAMAMVWSADGAFIGGLESGRYAIDSPSIRALVTRARATGSASDIVLRNGELMQLVVVSVRAPLPIAWVALGFRIDDVLTRELGALTGLSVSVAAATDEGGWNIAASSLESRDRLELAQLLAGVQMPWVGDGPMDFLTRIVPAIDGMHDSRSTALVLSRYLPDAFGSYRTLQRSLGAIAVMSVLLFWLCSVFVARRIARPLSELTRAAGNIEKGDYGTRVAVQGSSEARILTASFNRMLGAIQDREGQILRLAYEDPLTGLPNRVAFTRRLTEALAELEQDQPLAVVMLDIDRFSRINETLGYPVGDQMLTAVGQRLRQLLRPDDVVARMGADVFAILLPQTVESLAEQVIARIQRAMQEPLIIDGQPLDIVLSLGLAVAPEHGREAIALKRAAELAKQQAKRQGGHVVRFLPTLDKSRREHLSLIGELRQAIREDQLELHYQPKVELATGRAIEVEALIRWRHPLRGMIAPADFIPFAEQTGYIKALTRWVIEAAIAQVGRWLKQGIELRIAVNVSALDLNEPDLVRRIIEQMGRHAVCPEFISLEVTESGFMDDPERALATLIELDALGLRLAVDDFGTGYSSLAYLKRLPVSELKVDQTFVRHLRGSDDDAVIVRSTIDLGHNLGLEVTAEGVEDAESYCLLKEWGCDIAQGYHISRPLAEEALVVWYRERGNLGLAASGTSRDRVA